MKYFAYGSNMSSARLLERTPSAKPIGRCTLRGHDLRFHKAGADGSSKCDAFFTGSDDHLVHGVLFEIHAAEKPALDKAESLGWGYEEKSVTVIAENGALHQALTYVALRFDRELLPYAWYRNHVLRGANEWALPQDYIRSKIESIKTKEDTDELRNTKEWAVHD